MGNNLGRANYKIVKDIEDFTALIIRDIGPWDKFKSVTNVAEDVVDELVEQGLLPEGKRLLYFDSENNLDEILVKGGVFAGFAPWLGEE